MSDWMLKKMDGTNDRSGTWLMILAAAIVALVGAATPTLMAWEKSQKDAAAKAKPAITREVKTDAGH